MRERADNINYTRWEREANRLASIKRRVIRKLKKEGKTEKIKEMKAKVLCR